MRTSRDAAAKRWTAALVALVFTIVGQATLRPCPHHGSGAPAEPAVPAHTHASASHADSPRADAHPSAHEAERFGPEHHPDGPCTCVGNCHASAGAPLLAAGPGTEAPAGEAYGAIPTGSSSPALKPVPYLLPFANAPPLG